MSNQHPRGCLLPLIFALLLLAPAWNVAGASQDDRLPGEASAPTVDLAAVTLDPADLPERGYQLAQAGDLELEGLQFFWSNGEIDRDAWEPIASAYTHGYSTVHVLLGDRGDPRSEPIASLTTLVIGLGDDGVATEAVPLLLEIAGYAPSGQAGDVTLYLDRNGALGVAARSGYVVLVQYATAIIDGPGQNTSDWTDESVAELVELAADRLNRAIATAGSGEPALGVANLMVAGPDAEWTIPWIHHPNTEHYRVRNGETVPYSGELASDVRQVAPAGVIDLFVSRQQFGQEGYEHLVDITLARFETEADATAFAGDPEPVGFPPTWSFEVDYTGARAIDGATRLERASTSGEELRASGYRTVRLVGATVQVVQWLATGNALVPEDAALWLTARQSACLDALPEPCSPVPQDEVPVPLGADTSTPPAGEPAPTDGLMLASSQFGWVVEVPDEGWAIVDVELFGTVEFYRLQSGRSLMTVESAVDHHGDPTQCVLDNMRLLQAVEERAVIELGSDDPDERTAGVRQDHGWAIYTVEPLQAERADQEYTIRIDCYSLVEGQASLVVTHTAPRDLWIEERDKGERFRNGIRLPEQSAITAVEPLAYRERLPWRVSSMGTPRIWI